MVSTFEPQHKGYPPYELSDESHAPYPDRVTPTQRPSGAARTLLLIAAAIVVVESAVYLVLAVLGGLDASRDRAGAGIGVALVLAAYGGFQAWAAWRVTEGDSWARSPLVVTQLVQLVIAFNLDGVPTALTLAMGAASVITLVCLLAPPVTRALGSADPV